METGTNSVLEGVSAYIVAGHAAKEREARRQAQIKLIQFEARFGDAYPILDTHYRTFYRNNLWHTFIVIYYTKEIR